MRLVCLGDSFTEGLCDDLRPDGQHRGWADRVADALAPVEYANLAVRGKLLDQIVAEQIPAALSMAPDLVTFHAGGNDVLRRGTDLDDLFARYDAAVGQLPGRVLLFTSLSRAGGTGRLAEVVASRFAAFNANVREVSRRHATLLVDLDAVDALADRRLWYADRLHLNAQGHDRVAAAVLGELGHDTGDWWRKPLPAVSRRRLHDVGVDLLWAKNYLAPWVVRRLRGVSSGDGRICKDQSLRHVPTSQRCATTEQGGNHEPTAVLGEGRRGDAVRHRPARDPDPQG